METWHQALLGFELAFVIAFMIGWFAQLMPPDERKDGCGFLLLNELFIGIPRLLKTLLDLTDSQSDVRHRWCQTPSLRFCFWAFLVCLGALLFTLRFARLKPL